MSNLLLSGHSILNSLYNSSHSVSPGAILCRRICWLCCVVGLRMLQVVWFGSMWFGSVLNVVYGITEPLSRCALSLILCVQFETAFVRSHVRSCCVWSNVSARFFWCAVFFLECVRVRLRGVSYFSPL